MSSYNVLLDNDLQIRIYGIKEQTNMLLTLKENVSKEIWKARM